MKVYHSVNDIPFDKLTVLTVGTFDGVHIGHHALLRHLLELAREKSCRSVVVTFEPHPQLVLRNSAKPPIKLLTTLDEKLVHLSGAGVDVVVVLPFTSEFASLSAEEFIKLFVLTKIGVETFLIGHDHMFGKNRQGGRDLIKLIGQSENFDVVEEPPSAYCGEVVSSSKIRRHLMEGNISLSNSMLGYHYSITGEVVHGDKRGRELGIPTANIAFGEPKLLPANGVYVVEAEVGGEVERGLASVGTRPMFSNNKEATLEVFLFDFDDDLYGRLLTTRFLERIREEKTFPSMELFLTELESDKELGRSYFETRRG